MQQLQHNPQPAYPAHPANVQICICLCKTLQFDAVKPKDLIIFYNLMTDPVRPSYKTLL